MAVQHVIFDLFGTIGAGKRGILSVPPRKLFGFGHRTWMVEDRPEEQWFEQVCEELGCDLDKLRESFEQHKRSIQLLPGAKELIQKLHEEGYRLHLLSNAGRSVMDFIEREPAFKLFSSITLSCHVRAAKPDLRAFKAVLRKTEAVPDECVMVGDSEEQDIEPASLIGMHTVHVKKYDVDFDRVYEEIKAL